MNTPDSIGDLMVHVLPDQFFQLDPGSPFSRLFQPDQAVWTGLDRLPETIQAVFDRETAREPNPEGFHIHTRKNRENCIETIVSVEKGYYARADIFFHHIGIAVGSGSAIEPGVVIKPPLVLGKNSEVRQGAYIRGGAIIGDHCTVGHTTEVKTAVFMDHTEAGHFAYIGDSILGRCVNLGAGTKLANLPFRTLELKRKQAFEHFSIKIADRRINLGRSKLGAILGDGVETGCNSTLAPGTLIGPDSWIYPCLFVRSGVYKRNSLIRSAAANEILTARR